MTSSSAADRDLLRYQRQYLYAPLGESGQRRIADSKALVVGCGALGSVIANTLARAGVGHLVLVDRDFLELNNLQRQVLYDEADVRDQIPKAIAAQRRLEQINSEIKIDAIVADVGPANIPSLLEGVQTIVDGTDNFEVRFLLNDASHAYGIPWIYGGCIGAEGQTMTIIPGQTACLRCLMRDTPPPGSTPTCDTAGILGPIVNVIASLEACEALKILSGNQEAINRRLTVVDLWDNRVRQVDLQSLIDAGDCPACSQQDYPWLRGERMSQSAVLCGRNAVQLSHQTDGKLNLDLLAEKLRAVGQVTKNAYLLRLQLNDVTISVFADGRAIVSGTDDVSEARSLYARYLGN